MYSSKYHILEGCGFSRIHGSLFLWKQRTKSMAASAQSFPIFTLILSPSLSWLSGIPLGNCLVLITEVLSLAGEKLLHGGASMAAKTVFVFASCLMRCLTQGLVRSPNSPCSSSHPFALKPAARTAWPTPPCPAKRSATYLPFKRYAQAALVPASFPGPHPLAVLRIP